MSEDFNHAESEHHARNEGKTEEEAAAGTVAAVTHEIRLIDDCAELADEGREVKGGKPLVGIRHLGKHTGEHNHSEKKGDKRPNSRQLVLVCLRRLFSSVCFYFCIRHE